jgi:hypothetical protein
MPYIIGNRREPILTGESEPETAGELNFLLTSIVIDYLDSKEKVGYGELNEVIGVLEAMKLEFYRRMAAPYEDEKIEQNGDVY